MQILPEILVKAGPEASGTCLQAESDFRSRTLQAGTKDADCS